MPASEDFLRDQRKLHVVFLLSSVGLFLATIWMLAADHIKPWKNLQRNFVTVDAERTSAELEDKSRAIDQDKLEAIESQLDKATEAYSAKSAEVKNLQAEAAKIQLRLDKEEQVVQFAKAEQAEAMSSFDLIVGQIEITDPKAEASRHRRLLTEREQAEKRLFKLDEKIRNQLSVVEKTKGEISSINKKIVDLKAEVEKLDSDKQKITGDRDALARRLNSTKYGSAESIRALPILDGFASPLKVKQVALEELPIDYNFKQVTRFDRCQTCHLGIDKAGFTAENNVEMPYCVHPRLDLYVGPKSKHPVDKFGCTICHQGQGTATDFTLASHTPSDEKTMKEWEKDAGWYFNHFWELPMLPGRHTQSSCLKCHHDPYQIPEADKLLDGYKTIRTQGCYGCHEIDGYKDDGTSIGPNLRLAAPNDSEFDKKNALRKVGPSLVRVSEKLTSDYLWKWIRNPRAFRPSTKMPSFYYQIDEGFHGEGSKGEFDFGQPDPKDHELPALALTEVHAMTHYLLESSKRELTAGHLPKSETIAAAGDAARGKELFRTKGCVACHNHKDHPSIEKRGFGPELSEVGAKFTTPEQKQWLASWIKNPAQFNPMTYMPNVQLDDQASADLAAYLTSVPGEYAIKLEVTPVDKQALRDLVLSFMVKGTPREKAVAEVAAMSEPDQLFYLGQKTIARLGCFGCHDITGFEKAKPIGVGLADWGRKDPHKLAFENVPIYIEEQIHDPHTPQAKANKEFYEANDYYRWALGHHQREGFLMQKIREPRSYDEKKIRRWEDRTRMPQFNLNNEEREAVATFVFGLVGETINRKYVYNPSPAKQAEVQGRNLIEKYNCQSCHVFKPGEYKFTPGQEAANTLVELGKKELTEDYSFPGHSAWSVPEKMISKTLAMHVVGLPDGQESPDDAENPEDPKTFIKLWSASSVLGQVIPSGLKVGIPKSQVKPENTQAPYGGKYAEVLVDHLMQKSGTPNAAGERDKAWQKSPPPLIREGEKVQTPWLYRFLNEPVSIRPAVALRMPKFNFRQGDIEALANYFAAAENAPYPYFESPEREASYLEELNKKYPEYLETGFKLVTNKELCIKCHAIGGILPQGKPEELGPPLTRAQERLRPEWMIRWIANPKRIVPYTAMPVNFVKDKPQYQDLMKAPSGDQLRAARDVLINYQKITEQILGKQQAATKPSAPAGEQKGGME